jgi:hypothetical protein
LIGSISLAGAAAAAAGVVLVGALQPAGRSQIQSRVNLGFSVDHTFAITVMNSPNCSKAVCSVAIRFRNASHYPADIGAGSFVSPEQVGVADLCNPSPLASCSTLQPPAYYVISLVGNGNHYDYQGASFASNYLAPEQAVTAEFTFSVPRHAQIQSLELSGKSADAIVKF